MKRSILLQWRIFKHAFWIAPLLIVTVSCSNLTYYWQSARGHMSIMSQRQDIDELLQKPDLQPALRNKLALVKEIRAFASQQLQLPDNDSYTQYADIHRKYVVWNVFAAPEFSLQLKKWCFLFVGCVGYRGYYDEQDAKALAEQIKKDENLEVYVGVALAYSTLGWFDDPVLNTFINYPQANLAGLIFHELTHQLIYIKNDAAFNESLATMVEIEGVKRWLAAHPQSGDGLRYEKEKKVRKAFIGLLLQSNEQLKQLYQSDLPDSVKRRKKTEIIEQLKSRFQAKKQTLQELSVYDRWFNKPINNARLGSVATYQDYVPAFQQLLRECQGDLAVFYQRVGTLSELQKEQREAELNQLSKRSLLAQHDTSD